MACALREFFLSDWAWLVMGLLGLAGLTCAITIVLLFIDRKNAVRYFFVTVGAFVYVVFVNILLMIARSC